MSLSFERVGAAVLAAGLLASGTAWAQKSRTRTPAERPAQAQHAQPAAPSPTKVSLVGMQADWTKVCGHDSQANKDVCYTTRDFGAAGNQQPVLALAVYDIKGEEQRIVRMLLPVGLLLEPGFRFAIDKGAAMEGRFQICFPNGCFGESKVKGQTIEQLKRGTTMAVAVKNQANAEVTFDLPLAGFAKAFDGKAIDPKLLQQQQQALQEQLQKRAEEERQRLEATKGTAPAPAAAPAPVGHLPVPAAHK